MNTGMGFGMIFFVLCCGGLLFLGLIGGVIFYFVRKSNDKSSTTAAPKPVKPAAPKAETKADDSWLHEGNFSSDVVRGEPSMPKEAYIKPGSNIVGACPNCGGDIEAGWTECQYCGNAL